MASRTPALTVGALAVAIVAVSSSGPMIAYAAASGLAIAFWRTALAVGVIGPAALLRRRGELRALVGPARREGLFCVLAGVALAAHFATWVPSVKLTAVATAAALVAIQPVWQGVIAVLQGRRLPGWTWVGIGLAVAGAVAATGADLGGGPRVILGDVLALVGGVAAAVYTALGERARTTVSTTGYTAVCYLVCGSLLLVVCLAGRQPLAGYPGSTWLALVGLTLGPQLLGHSMFSFAVRRVAATTVAVVTLLEVPGAALLGWAWLGQTPRLATLPGLGLLVAGVAVVTLAGRRRRGAPDRAPRSEPEPGAGVIVAEVG